MESKLGFWDLILSRLSQLPTLEWIIYQFLCFWGRDSTTQIFNCRRWWRGGAALWISPNPYIVQGSTVYAKCCKNIKSVQSVSSVAQSCPTLCDPMNHSTPGLPVYHQLPEFTQTHVHRVNDAIQPSHPLSSPSPPAPNPSQHQGLFKWISSLHQIWEFQLQHQSFQWTPRTDFL